MKNGSILEIFGIFFAFALFAWLIVATTNFIFSPKLMSDDVIFIRKYWCSSNISEGYYKLVPVKLKTIEIRRSEAAKKKSDMSDMSDDNIIQNKSIINKNNIIRKIFDI